jgi:hypothetical protein
VDVRTRMELSSTREPTASKRVGHVSYAGGLPADPRGFVSFDCISLRTVASIDLFRSCIQLAHVSCTKNVCLTKSMK